MKKKIGTLSLDSATGRYLLIQSGLYGKLILARYHEKYGFNWIGFQ